MSKRLPSFRGIEAFIVTASSLNLRRAAENLNISTSAVSRRIQSLEDEIGTQLFVRGGRLLALTPAGKHYHQSLLPTLEVIHQATQSIGSQERDTISVLGLQSFITCWLLPRFSRFQSQFPFANIVFSTLRKRKLDYTDIVIEPRFDAEDYAGLTKMFAWSSTPVCRADLIAAHGISSPRDTTKLTLLDSDAPVSPWPTWLKEAGVHRDEPLRWMKFDTFLPMASALREGLGFAQMPWFYLIGQEQLTAPFDLATRLPGGIFLRNPAGYERPIVQRFREWIMDEINETSKHMPSWA